MSPRAPLLAALMVAMTGWSGPALAWQDRDVRVGDLIGLTTSDAAGRLGDPDVRPGFAAIDGLTLTPLSPARCRFSTVRDAEAPLRVMLVSRDQIVVSVTSAPLSRPAPGAPVHGKVQPLPDNPLAPVAGELPLADGLPAATSRLTAAAFPEDERLVGECRAPDAPRTAPRSAGEDLVAAPIAVAAAVWFSPIWIFGVPSENRSRALGQQEGAAALAVVRLGEPLPGGPEGFRAAHSRVVRVHAGEAPDYAIVTIDLGGPPGRGVSLPRQAVYLGVREGRVEWMSDGRGGVQDALCTLQTGHYERRRGCSTTGYYSPRL